MHLLYLDESGSIDDSTQKHFVLAGVSVFERKTHWVEEQLELIAKRFSRTGEYVELHGSPMRSGGKIFRKFPKKEREQALLDALNIVRLHTNDGVRLFGAVISKQSVPGQDPVEVSFEQIANRFDLFLRRLYARNQDPQRGLILFDKSSTERRIQTLAREFKLSGHTWGKTKNYADVPVFLDSNASRLIQLADLVAFALYRHFEHGDSQYFNVIQGSFDAEGGVVH